MKNRTLEKIWIILLIGMISLLHAYEKTANGIVLDVNQGGVQKIKIQVCDEDILHIMATPESEFSTRPSLAIENFTPKKVQWSVEEQGGIIYLKTQKLTAKINAQTGQLTFEDADGNVLLQEKTAGKTINKAVVMDEDVYQIREVFDSPADEAFYGLGQHQNNVMNYKNRDVDLWQYNIVAVVPFLLSSKNYGILWDNNSRTKFGDVRDYISLSNLKLINKDGKPGGLTAEYFRDEGMDSLFTVFTEPRIQHEYLDVNDPYVNGFRDNVRAIRYSGEIEADETGVYQFRLYSSSFAKMWLNGELVVDSWRQNWLPWTHYAKLNMEEGKRYKIKIEWIPNSGYMGLRYLPPIGTPEPNTMSLWSEVADQIDYYFVQGKDLDEVVQGYRELTGQAPLMPKWALGFWQCRERYISQKQLLSVVKEFRDRKIPIDNIVQDWMYWPEDKWGDHDFDTSRFPDPEGMMKTLHEDLNAHLMISVWPKFYMGTEHYEQMDAKGFLYKRNIEKLERDWVGPGYYSSFYDPYSQASRDLFWKQINAKLFSKGIDAWWLDATEPDIHSNLSRPETRLRLGPTQMGSIPRYLNTFSLMNAKGIYEGQRQVEPNQRVFILTRSAFAGQQRYSAATWSGDIATRWYDLKAQIPAGINFCMSGIPYWTTDIGGFAVEPRFERNVKPEDLEEWREFNTRWFQFGTFCPIFRVHGQYPLREMFNIAPGNHLAYQTMLAYDNLRYRLMPYIYSVAGAVTHYGASIMRGLVMDFASDSKVLNIGDQFLFGPSIMVCPVTDYKARSRSVYLPKGSDWYGLQTGTFLEGGQNIDADAPYSDIPLYVKAGAIVPFGPELQYTSEMPEDPIRLMVYTGADGQFTLYEDEGINYNYEKGKFSVIPMAYNESETALTIGERSGSFEGMLEKRTFEIVWISPDSPQKLNFFSKPDMTVQYDGEEIVVRK